jgi:hypothetical protein
MSDLCVTLVSKKLIYKRKLRFSETAQALISNIMNQTPTLWIGTNKDIKEATIWSKPLLNNESVTLFFNRKR